MDKVKRKQIMIGDWVNLRSSKGEQIHGYVEKTTGDHEVVQLRVVSSENQILVGQSIQVQVNKVTKEDEIEQYSAGELKQLIDLALLTNDKAWFGSLMTKYQKLKIKQNN
ncbi:MAG TPA: IDEAL domain-containing protein [Bacilli bacterium]|nr:IDEAL domain-containing protein [Bacilli bacterium]